MDLIKILNPHHGVTDVDLRSPINYKQSLLFVGGAKRRATASMLLFD
jgi:hypothetical protein